MSLSVDELRKTVANLKNEGLNSQQIADELSLSQDTIAWLSSSNEGQEQPQDVRIGWRTIGVRPIRTEAMATIFADVLLEEVGEEGVETALAGALQQENLVDEAADLIYHLIVLLEASEKSIQDVVNKLEERHGS